MKGMTWKQPRMKVAVSSSCYGAQEFSTLEMFVQAWQRYLVPTTRSTQEHCRTCNTFNTENVGCRYVAQLYFYVKCAQPPLSRQGIPAMIKCNM